jgi:hypothetical protein
MCRWGIFTFLALLAAGGQVARAQSCNLTETIKADECFRTRLETKLTGEMRFQKGSGTLPIKQDMTAEHTFVERCLQVSDKGDVEKSARYYDTAKAHFVVGRDAFDKAQRAERRLIVAHRRNDQIVVYSPAGPLTRTELEAVGDHFDAMVLSRLLPGKDVSVGDTWRPSNGAVQAACNFEGLAEQKIDGKLESIKDDVAEFSLSGTASGIDTGALVKVNVQAKGKFDIKSHRVVSLEWTEKDERDQGPASPAMTAETKITLQRERIDQPDNLSNIALVSVPPGLDIPPEKLQLDYRDPKGRYALLHSREWYISSVSDEHVVMRLLDRGDFVAQVTITPWRKAEPGKHITPEELKQQVNEATGWQPEKELQAGEVSGQGEGRWVYRLSEEGKLDDLQVIQNYYVVAAKTGEQVFLVFTLTRKQADKLAERDLSLVGSIDVPAPAGK